jgi:hypothetical protein
MGRKSRTFGDGDETEGKDESESENESETETESESESETETETETETEGEGERSGDPAESENPGEEIIAEATELANKVGDAINSLWDSPGRKGAQDDAKKVANDMGKGVAKGLKFLNRKLDGRGSDWREDRGAARDADDEVDDLEK